MCTLTVVPLRDGRNRLAFNRDEQRTRPAALPPQTRQYGDHAAVLPIDPVSDGTWVALSDAGLAFALVNATTSGWAGPDGPVSRGTIIPALLACDTLHGAVERSRELSPRDYGPFRLVLVSVGSIAEVRSDGRRLVAEGPSPLTGPRLFTSSGLGDELVLGPRRRLFDEQFSAAGDWAECQDAFHRHSWPVAPHLSVCMSRPDACTVSLTLVEFTASGGTLTYRPGAPDRPARPVVAQLAFGEVVR